MADQEQRKMEHAGTLAQYDAENAQDRELFKAVITAGQSALKSAILINGGAAVALLAVIGGTLNTMHEKALMAWLLVSVILLVLGVLVAAIAAGLTYLAQRVYHLKDDNNRSGDAINNAVITLVVISYVLFAIGCIMPIVVLAVKTGIDKSL